MTVQAMPWAIHGASHPGENARSLTAAIFGVPVAVHTSAASVTTAGGGHGVISSTDLAVAQNGTPNMSVNVAAGRALIRAGHTGNITSGCYSFLNDATVNLIISAADATNPRYDLVIAQVRDTNYGEAANEARLTVVTGTPAATPADPSLTSYPNCLVLARVQVDAGATSIVTAKITDLRTRAYAAGGHAVVASAAALPTGASLYAGLHAYAIAEQREYLYDGTGWIIVTEPWQTYNTFTATNVTLSNGTKTGRYRRSLGNIQFELDLTFGSSTTLAAAGNPVSFSLPMNVTNSISHRFLVGYLVDASAGVQCPSFWVTAVNGASLTPMYLASITQLSNNGVYAGAPWVWQVNDQIRISGTLPMSSLYS